MILHNDNKDWSIKRICDYIAARNEDIEHLGFSSRTIHNYLNDENRQLVDTSRKPKSRQSKSLKKFREQKGKIVQNNVMEHDVETFQHHLLEDSSIRRNDQEEGVIKEYDIPEPEDSFEEPQEEEQKEEVIYDDPARLIKQYEKQIEDLIKINQKLAQDYERVITTYEIIETVEIDGKEFTHIIHVNPYKRTAWTEPDLKQQRNATKLNKGMI